jgi:peptide-methionine (R)-S-oxide reductase
MKNKDEKFWKENLSPEEFYVTRKKGTELAFSGKYHDHSEAGNYHCICCDQFLFSSISKFYSSCGWPAFSEPGETKNIIKRDDYSLRVHRVEVLCAGCEAHLGHIFDDGPPPVGIRYCINSVSLKFKEA